MNTIHINSYKSFLKKLMLLGILLISILPIHSQNAASTNTSFAGMEKNLLFYATNYYKVTQTGSSNFNLPMLFDGNFHSNLSEAIPTQNNPTVITISGLLNQHVQSGAWVGWSTRYRPAKKFKIEGFTGWDGGASSPINKWVVLADVDNHSSSSFYCAVPHQSYTQLRFTFYESTSTSGLDLSELFFIHPEATIAYDKIMVKYNRNGNVGLGTDSPDHKLDVVGTIRAHEVMVNTQKGADFVFDENYALRPLSEVEEFITIHKHLPEIKPASEMEQDGLNMSEFQIKLLQKIEELTLYLIEQEKINKEQESRINELKQIINTQK